MTTKILFVPLLILALAAGCASAPKVTQTESGFLSDYSKLKTTSEENAAAYQAEGYDLKNYGHITFDPVQVHLSDKLVAESSLKASQQEKIAQYVADELNRRLAGGFKGQGTGTLNVRAAISGITSSSEELSAWQYLPVTLAVAATLEAAGKRDKALVLFQEAEAIDDATGEIVVAKIKASELGLVDNSDFEKDPIGTLKPLLAKWIDKLVDDFNQKLR